MKLKGLFGRRWFHALIVVLLSEQFVVDYQQIK